MHSLVGKGSIYICVLFLFCFSLSSSKDTENHKPRFTVDIFHGIVEENSDRITLDPPLFVEDGDEGQNGQICRIFIQEDDIPFTIDVVDADTGEGVIAPKSPDLMDCEQSREWHFHIRAEDCAERRRRSHSAEVHILVNDSNDNAPKFKSQSYEATVNEGVITTDFLRLEAVDDDCSEANSMICGYEIVTPDVPFTISQQGSLSTTKELEAVQQSYFLAVVAADCSHKRSEPVMVTVHVGHVCIPGWKDFPQKVQLSSDETAQFLAPKSYLETCGNPVCNNSEVTTTLTLQTDHIGFGCDRDTYSLKSQRENCNAEAGAVDLLPSPSQQSPWMANLNTDEGNESEKVFFFDGQSSQATLPEKVAPKNVTDRFSISFWMKHKPRVGGDKEYILANSDTEGSNKRHYAVYLHNCRLTFLLHRESDATDIEFPSEYRWKLDHVCDSQWHRYTFNVQYPQISLFVDTKLYETSRITNDWPLPHLGTSTTLTVGAAWNGASSTYSGFFKGYLAGMSILPGNTESEQVISCLFACKEGLSIDMGNLPLEVVHLNAEGTVLTLKGSLKGGFSQVLKKVSYYNSRTFPTPGSRDLLIETTATCDNQEIHIPDIHGFIVLSQVPVPNIIVTGDASVAYTVAELHDGVKVLESVSISNQAEEDEGEVDQDTGETDTTYYARLEHLDSCQVTVVTPFKTGEQLSLDEDICKKYSVNAVSSDEGLIITGVKTVATYEAILRQVVYINKAPNSTPSRTLSVRCSELNERFVSNAFEIEVSLVHKKAPPHQSKSGGHLPNHFQVKSQLSSGKHHAPTVVKRSSSPAMTLVLVVCVGFFMFMIVVGVFRVYTTRKVNKALDDKQDMDWDDGPLNITVNPMEGPIEPVAEDSSDDDYDDDCSEMSSSSEEEIPVCVEYKGSPLEWDDSNLKF